MTAYTHGLHQSHKEKSDLSEKDENLAVTDSENGTNGVEVSVKQIRNENFGRSFGFGALLILTSALLAIFGVGAPGYMYWIVAGLHHFFIGVFRASIPRERASFEVAINGKQRSLILDSINLFFSLIGILCMSAVGLSWTERWSFGNTYGFVIGLGFSLSIALVILLQLSAGPLPNPDCMDNKLQDLITKMKAATISLFPNFSNFNLTKILQVPKNLRCSAVHYIIIALSMFLAAGIFSAQVLDTKLSPENLHNEINSDSRCMDSYVRNRLLFLGSVFSPSSTKLIVLISSLVTVFLSLPLFVLTHRSSSLSLILAFIISAALTSFHFFQTYATMYWIIMPRSFVTPPTFNLCLGITIASLILASLFLSLALSYLDALLHKDKHEDEIISSSKKICSMTFMVALIIITTVTISALIFSVGGISVAMQGEWNSAISGKYSECHELYVSQRIEDKLRLFSLAHSSLSAILLTLSFLLALTNNRISRPIHLLFGITSFATAITTLIFFFTGVFDYVKEMPNLYPFHISNACLIALGLVLGLCFSFSGCGFFVSFFSILLRSVIGILAFNILLIFRIAVGIINLAKLSVKTDIKEEKESMMNSTSEVD